MRGKQHFQIGALDFAVVPGDVGDLAQFLILLVPAEVANREEVVGGYDCKEND